SGLVEDFQELRRTLETLNMFSANLGFFFLHLAQILTLEALAWGLSAKWWNNWLSQHHVKTNIYPKDPDIKVGPFYVIGDLQPVKGPEEVRSPLDGCLLQPSRNIMWMCIALFFSDFGNETSFLEVNAYS
ncbi:hypothetical protein MJG53_010717, partial [Ovis ammon polii x Ovis aries]